MADADDDRAIKRLMLEVQLEQERRLRIVEEGKLKETELKIEMEKTRQLQLKSGALEKPVSISTMTSTAFGKVARHFKVSVLNPKAPTADVPNASIVPYTWPPGTNEKSQMSKLNEHLSAQLQRLGVCIGEPGGYDVAAVHDNPRFWQKTVATVVVRGSPDAVIVPHSVSPLNYTQHVRVAIEYKTPTFMEKQNQPIKLIQPVMELLMAQADSDYPVLVLFTDMESHFHVLRASGNSVLHYKDLCADTAFSMLVSHLRAPGCASVSVAPDNIPEDERVAMELIKAAVPPSALEEQLEVLDELPLAEREDTARQLMFQHLISSMYT